ncbi:hypothetical protein ABXT00_14160, partial [Stenotrophomonas koreensis]|uniref:hypothetical protein n=1 Tax=Stenotrophomonas koreensis TaxID=266128 RepID=UPI0033925D85
FSILLKLFLQPGKRERLHSCIRLGGGLSRAIMKSAEQGQTFKRSRRIRIVIGLAASGTDTLA